MKRRGEEIRRRRFELRLIGWQRQLPFTLCRDNATRSSKLTDNVHIYTSVLGHFPVHRTQIYLQDSLHDSLKTRARSVGVSMSELIRRTLEKDIHSDPVSDARAYFDRLKPLESFAGTTSKAYVQKVRSTSRLLRKAEKS